MDSSKALQNDSQRLGVLFLHELGLEKLNQSEASWIKRIKFLHEMRRHIVQINRSGPQAKKNISRGLEKLLDFYEEQWNLTDSHDWILELRDKWDLNNLDELRELKAMSYENTMYSAGRSIQPPLTEFHNQDIFKVYFNISQVQI